MTTFAASETRLRRMLRDPNGDIWTSMDLQTYFNDAQVELAQKTNLLVRVEAHYYPPRYDWAYLFDWEQEYLNGDTCQALQINQASGEAISYPWEAGWYLSTSSTPDDGSRFFHPWEAHYCSPADPPGIKLHSKFDKMKYIAYDREKIEPIDEKRLRDTDRWYRTRTGEVLNYWRPDDYSNLIYLYPMPGSVSIVEPDVTNIFSDSSTENFILREDGYYLLREDGSYFIKDVNDTGWINTSAEAWLDETDYGLVTDVISTENALFTVYTAQPDDIEETIDEGSFPDFLVKYIEYATLERAYSADTDGFIPSLRDYWKLRKEIGLKALAKFQRLTLADRDYRLGGQPQPTSSTRLRLPDGYPAV